MNNPFFRTGQNDDSGVFSGGDIQATILSPNTGHGAITLKTLNTISYSLHREKVPVRRLGRSRAVGHTRGTRTIAGTMVFINFNEAALSELLFDPHITSAESEGNSSQENDPRSGNLVADQLPPFHMIFTLVNEDGQVATLALYDIEIVDEGSVMGVDESYVETTMQYLAKDIDILSPGKSITQLVKEVESQANTGLENYVDTFTYRTEKEYYRAWRNFQENGAKVKQVPDIPWTLEITLTPSQSYFSGIGNVGARQAFQTRLNQLIAPGIATKLQQLYTYDPDGTLQADPTDAMWRSAQDAGVPT